MVIPPLRRKVVRDLQRLWVQVLAIALVLAAGVATLILGNGAYSALHETRARYYQENNFADVFADVTRAPRALLAEIEAIEGVLDAEDRIVKFGLLDLQGMKEPGSVLLVSLAGDNAGLNQLYLRRGRLPDPQSAEEIVIAEGFATVHGLGPGDRLPVLMNGNRRELLVTGVALSPEFIYALGPGQMMPDPRRFGIVWAPRAGLEASFDLEGAFSNVVLKLAPGANQDRVIEMLDRLTARYGGIGASPREDQISHAFLDAELKQLSAMVKVLPPIFLLVAALLVNMTLSRLITLEREQIGLLKALGYSSRAVALHYIEFVSLIAILGILIGMLAGSWLGAGLAEMYGHFFSFPYLVFTRDPRVYGLAAIITTTSAIGGALYAVRTVVRLPPAVAMAPPLPASYRQRIGWFRRLVPMRQTGVMVARHLFRWPFRTASSTLGVAMAVAILVASLWSFGSINYMIDITFFRTERHDAQVVFGTPEPQRTLLAVRQMPGVLAAEPIRVVKAQISNRNLSKKLGIMGHPAGAELSRVLDTKLKPMTVPESGLILSEALADALKVRPGDLVKVDVLEGARPSLTLPVRGISLGYVGLGATMNIAALNRLMGEGALFSGLNLMIDKGQNAAFYTAAKAAPKTEMITVTSLMLNRFKETLAENITVMITVYVSLATIIAVGVVYNFSRISMSEQGRELASLRVLGFTENEVAGVLFAELAIVVLLAQPIGWLIGYGIGLAMVAAFSSDLYRVPYLVERGVFAIASLVVLAAALASAFAILSRIKNLDMIEVLKTRE